MMAVAGTSRNRVSYIVVKDKTILPGPMEEGVKIYQFRISLYNTEPEVWRRVDMPGDFTIAQFGRAVMKSIGWIQNFQYIFTGPDEELIHDPSEDDLAGLDSTAEEKDGIPKTKDATKIRVSELYSMDKTTSMLEVCADTWIHEIELEAIKDPEGRKWYPKCTAGANACPPGESGGSGYYLEMIEAMRDPKHPQHEETKEWLEGMGYEKFNPKKFKLSDIRFYDN